MGKKKGSSETGPLPKALVWVQGEVKTPPFTPEGRQEAGMLFRLLQEGEQLGMPQAEPLPEVGRGAEHCGFETRSTAGESCTESTQTPCSFLRCTPRRRREFLTR